MSRTESSRQVLFRTPPFPSALVLPVALAVAASSCLSSAPPQAPTKTAHDSALATQSYELANGLRVVLAPDDSAASVVIFERFDVGSKDEVPGKTGFAHLFEHLMFEGSTHVPHGQYDALLEAGGGYSNGSTDEDCTIYYEIVPPNYLELALYLDADRLAGLWDAMNEQVLSAQRDVVDNERRESNENVPYGRIYLSIPPALWGEEHGNGHDTIGSAADLAGASLADVEAFWRRYYVPAGATLLLVGKLDVALARRLVERYFGWIPRRPAPLTARLEGPVTPRAGATRILEPDDVSTPKVIETWRSPPPFAAGDVELAVLAQILAGGKNSRLYRRLVFDGRLASEVNAEVQPHVLGGRFAIEAVALEGVSALALEAALDGEMAALRSAPPTAAEVQRARAVLESQLLRRMENLVGRAERLAEYDAYLGDPDHLDDELAALAAVTPAAVQQAVNTWLGIDARVIATVVPRASSAGGSP